MTNIHLEQIRRRLKLNTPAPEQPPPAPTSDLGVALEQLIRQAAQAGATEAVRQLPAQQQAPAPKVAPHLREFTDQPLADSFPPPPPMAKPIKDLTVSLQRDEVGRAKFVTVGNDVRFEVQRDAEGRVIRMIQVE